MRSTPSAVVSSGVSHDAAAKRHASATATLTADRRPLCDIHLTRRILNFNWDCALFSPTVAELTVDIVAPAEYFASAVSAACVRSAREESHERAGALHRDRTRVTSL